MYIFFKYFFLILSKIFGFVVFTFTFSLIYIQFESLNLKLFEPFLQQSIFTNYEKKVDIKLNEFYIKFDKNKYDLIFFLNNTLKNKNDLEDWKLELQSKIKVTTLINNLNRRIIDFEIVSLKSEEDFSINEFYIDGSYNIFSNKNSIIVEATAKNLPLNFVKSLWPNNLGKGAREWTLNSLFNGSISELTFDSQLILEKDGTFLDKPKINLYFAFNDIDTYYLKDMPPITNTIGRGYLNFDTFKISLDDGLINLNEDTKIFVNEGEFNAFDIRKRHGPGRVIINASSNVGNFFSLLSEHDYVSKLVNLDRNNLSGESKLLLKFDFPLKNSLRFIETKINIDLDVEELTIFNKNRSPSIISSTSILELKYNYNVSKLFNGSILTENIKILELPIFAQILDVSIPGLSNISDGGRDITFSSSSFSIELSNKHIMISDGILKPESNLPVVGNSLGLSIAGDYLFNKKEIDFTGTIVPISWLNNLPSNVPLLGELFSGSKEGEGLIGIKFRVYNQNNDEIKIETNPLSVLTPGFLQRIFD